MEYKLCEKSSEIITFMAKVYKVDPEFLLNQLSIVNISMMLTDAEYRRPNSQYTFFEDNEFPCDHGETIEDHYSWFKEIQSQLAERFNIYMQKQQNLFNMDSSVWAKAKDVAIDCLQDVAA